MLSISPRVAAAAGEDYAAVRNNWQVVEVVVPPGPLGILLDSAERNAAVLEGFAAIDASGTRGVVERDGRVTPGSVLVRVNEYNLTAAEGMTFADIGHVLRETSHLERTLCFNVPVPTTKSISTSASQNKSISTVLLSPPPSSQAQAADAQWSDDDDAALTHELELVSPASVGLPDHSDAPLSPPPSSATLHAADTAQSSPSDAPAAKKTWGFALPKNLPKGMPSLPKNMPHLPKSMPNLPKGLPSLPKGMPSLPKNMPHLPKSMPTIATLNGMLFDDVSATGTGGATAIEEHIVVVDVPPGPLGLNLDGAITDRAVVIGFAALPDGSCGAIETHGGVRPGAELVAINSDDVSAMPLEQIRLQLSDLCDTHRTLAFRVKQPVASTGSVVAVKPVPLVEDLALRRTLELALIVKYDKATIDRHECWFVIDAVWMAAWINFAAKSGPLPGPIANDHLLADQWEARLDGVEVGRPDAIRSGLERSKHYRCVTPMVWCLFVELHGTTRAPVLARYVLDINADAAGDSDVATILRTTHLKAAALASELRDKCVVKASERK